MSSKNQVQLLGNLGNDMELRGNQGSNRVGVFSLAVTESYKNDKNERVERTNWFNCVIFGKYAESMQQYLKKGTPVLVSGALRSRSYDDKEKGKVYVCEVVATEVIQFYNK